MLTSSTTPCTGEENVTWTRLLKETVRCDTDGGDSGMSFHRRKNITFRPLAGVHCNRGTLSSSSWRNTPNITRTNHGLVGVIENNNILIGSILDLELFTIVLWRVNNKNSRSARRRYCVWSCYICIVNDDFGRRRSLCSRSNAHTQSSRRRSGLIPILARKQLNTERG